ncbi:MAG: NTP transferase domain-containing protein [Chlorobi bacterium]|nr:NTP transferase domain-containing protein [Chlorobiota bacterium]
MSDLVAVVMAAGKGTRMNDPKRAKVMFPIGGRPMIAHVIERAYDCGAERVILVVGYKGEAVRRWVENNFSNAPIGFVEQIEQLGTAHAVMQALPMLRECEGDVFVLSGDVPLLTDETLKRLIALHREKEAAGTLLTVVAPDPTGYGRVIRGEDGTVMNVVEHKDATEEERQVDEINAGVYLFKSSDLLRALPRVQNDNAQGEYYLPDVISIFLNDRLTVVAHCSENFDEIQGINTPEQLADADRLYRRMMVQEKA